MNEDEIVDFLNGKVPDGTRHFNWDKSAFLRSLPHEGVLLDVGCGNNSPIYTKQALPGWRYIGIDVGDYNQSGQASADEYLIVTSEKFAEAIEKHHESCDAVISSHNLEHCENRIGTLVAMAQALRRRGKLFLSFPAEASINFPSRRGCLNFYDDHTHKDAPPDFGGVVSILVNQGLRVVYASTRYQSPLSWIVGIANEAASSEEQEVKDGTWALWGFETIIWAEKL